MLNGAIFGATPPDILTKLVPESSQGKCAAKCPASMTEGVESYKWMKPFAGMFFPSNSTVTESWANEELSDRANG